MAKTRRAYTGGAVSTTTTSSIAASGVTSFTITAGTGWPYGSDPFYVVVEPGTASEEKILVTRTGVGDTTIDIASDSVRGLDGTAAVSHGSGVTVFPVFTAVDADEANELASRWSTKGDLVSYGSSTFEKLGVGTNDHVLTAASGEASGLKWGQVATAGIADDAVTTAKIDDGAVTGAKLAQGYTYAQTVYFTSSGTFTKATYSWLRAIRVRVQGGGGGGAGSNGDNSAGGGGGGGGYAEKFITDIAGLSASVTVTVGAGGAAGGAATSGSAGGNSSFDTVTGNGGGGGDYLLGTTRGGGGGGNGSNADVVFRGSGGGSPGPSSPGPVGGASHLGGGGYGSSQLSTGGIQGGPGLTYGGGGAGGVRYDTTNYSGGAGAAGIVIVELYA